MFNIKDNIKIFTDYVEESALQQLYSIANSPLGEAEIRIMPDVHAGAGCVIGTAMELQDKVCPNLVGVDIGCGMLTVKIDKKVSEIDFEELDTFIRKNIPFGFEVNSEENYSFDINELHCGNALENKTRILKSIGTLGGGNHFAEIDKDKDDNAYLIIHTGSRNLGKQIAEIYQNIAVLECKTLKLKEREEIIAKLQHSEPEKIEEALVEHKTKWNIPKGLEFLYQREDIDKYYDDMKIASRFASENRMEIANKIMSFICPKGFHWDYFETIHNYIDFSSGDKNPILRKGAIRANKGEKVLIPINMRDGCILGIGKGNPDWFNSAPHGAGRIMSRGEAKREIQLEDFVNAMEGIYSTSVSESTLDESPFAYKSIEDIINNIEETVEIIDILKPVYNIKA